MSNVFDPKLRADLAARKLERKLEEARQANKQQLKDYLEQRGLTDVNQDPSLTRVVPRKPVSR